LPSLLFCSVLRHVPWSGRQRFKDIQTTGKIIGWYIFRSYRFFDTRNVLKRSIDKDKQTGNNVRIETVGTDKINSSILRGDLIQPAIFSKIDVNSCGVPQVGLLAKVPSITSWETVVVFCCSPLMETEARAEIHNKFRKFFE
jgi:hypothetical protein